MSNRLKRAGVVAGVCATAAAASMVAASSEASPAAARTVRIEMRPSSSQLARCMPNADVHVSVQLTTDAVGFDSFTVDARGLPRNTDFTTFLIQKAGTPFGAAEYIGDVSSDATGRAHNQFRLIVQEAFASTLVGVNRVRVDLNRVGMWFADPAADNFCLGAGSPVTPFDGDNAAGVQAFNSGAAKLPPP
jgi:hypothetical protein